MSIPPTHDATFAPAFPNNHSSSRCTCSASSRVGATTSASGSRAVGSRASSPSRVAAIASPYATVFPEPVCAETRRSFPAVSGSSTAACTGVGSR